MTKKEASMKYYSSLFKLAQVLLLIGIDAIVIIPLFVEKYYAYSGLFIAFNIMAIKLGIEYLSKTKKETNIRNLKPEDKNEERKLFFEAILEGVRSMAFSSAILISIILLELNLIKSDYIRILSIVTAGLLFRICLSSYLNKIHDDYLQI